MRGAPNVGLISRLEDCINEGDVDKFYEDDELNKWYLEFVHNYVILCVADKTEVTRRMSDPVSPQDIFQHVTPEFEARALVLVVNGHESWADAMSSEETMMPQGKRKRCIGRWTGTKDGRTNKTRLANCTAWSDEGLKFLDDACAFFERLRDDQRHDFYASEAQSWYLNEVVAPAANQDREAARKKTRRMMRADDAPANYSNLGKWAKKGNWAPV